ncbi:MAG: hypothetical protein RL621_341 [Bacteroidota bacterium]|jgi:hypothetical protein
MYTDISGVVYVAADHIRNGNISSAYRELEGKRAYTHKEIKFLDLSCRVANMLYKCNLKVNQFLV